MGKNKFNGFLPVVLVFIALNTFFIIGKNHVGLFPLKIFYA